MSGKMGITTAVCLFALIGIGNLFGQESDIKIEPIRLGAADSVSYFRRSVCNFHTRFADDDTVLFMQKAAGLEIVSIDKRNVYELEVLFRIDAAFGSFGEHRLMVCDSTLQRKVAGVLEIISLHAPRIDSVRFTSLGKSLLDTILVDLSRPLAATLCVYGNGIPIVAQIEFADPAVFIKQYKKASVVDTVPSMCADIEIRPEATLGECVLTVKSPYSPSVAKRIFCRSMRPPRLFTEIDDMYADGKKKSIVLEGNDFASGVSVRLAGPSIPLRTRRLSTEKLEIKLTLPALDEAARCRLIVQNPDGRDDSSNVFLLLPPPLAAAKALPLNQSLIFSGRPVRLLITTSVDQNRRLQKGRSYDLIVDSQRYPVQIVTSDSTCEAEIELSFMSENRAVHQHVFTLQEAGKPPLWRGVFSSRLPPRIDYITSERILHPADTLTLIIKGARLKEVTLGIADPEVFFQIVEQSDDLLRVTAVASLRSRFGEYPLEACIQGTVFTFENYKIAVRPWQPLTEYVVFHLSSAGDLPAEACFRGVEGMHIIKREEILTVRIKAERIRPELGTQKLLISGVLTDSSGAVRAEALDNRRFLVSPNGEELIWRWRARERIRSGDRLEITLQNPGNQNRITEYFVVEPHWSEAFHGSTSFILCKIPLGDGDEKTQILNSIGLGVSWQPFIRKRFLELDAAFIVGNARSAKSDYAVEVGMGVSAIFWQHLQLGVGANLTGNSLSKGFLFIGTRFKLPVAL